MSHQKLAVLVATSGVALAVISGASPANAAPAQSSAATKSPAYFSCKSPKGKYLAVSWKKAISTKFYFNNHCKQKRTITVKLKPWGWPASVQHITVNPQTHGNKTIWTGTDTITVTSTS